MLFQFYLNKPNNFPTVRWLKGNGLNLFPLLLGLASMASTVKYGLAPAVRWAKGYWLFKKWEEPFSAVLTDTTEILHVNREYFKIMVQPTHLEADAGSGCNPNPNECKRTIEQLEDRLAEEGRHSNTHLQNVIKAATWPFVIVERWGKPWATIQSCAWKIEDGFRRHILVFYVIEMTLKCSVTNKTVTRS